MTSSTKLIFSPFFVVVVYIGYGQESSIIDGDSDGKIFKEKKLLCPFDGRCRIFIPMSTDCCLNQLWKVFGFLSLRI